MDDKQIEDRIRLNRAKHLLPADEFKTQHLSISSMMGKKVVDLVGYVSQHFGFDAPVFNVSAVIFEDGTKQRLQGEHDIVYFPADDVPGLTNRDLLLCMDPDDIDEDDEEDFVEYLAHAEEDEKLDPDLEDHINGLYDEEDD